MTIAQLMLPELKAEAAMTRKLIAKVPNDKLAFTPGHGLNTIGWNVAHLAEIVGWVPWTLDGDGWAEERVTIDPVKRARDPSAGLILERVRRIELAEMCPGERVGPDGWVLPPRLGAVDDADPFS